MANSLFQFFQHTVDLPCIVIVPIAATLTQVSLVKCLAVCGMFLVCAAVGIVLALILLLRFDTLALLTKTD